MNPRWILIRRLRGPAFLLTFGVTALLHQWNILSFGESWPLYLIVAGVLSLLERAALTAPDGNAYPMGSYPNQYPNTPYPQGWAQPGQPPASPSTAIVPTGPTDITPEGR
jgi:hypothetical protein